MQQVLSNIVAPGTSAVIPGGASSQITWHISGHGGAATGTVQLEGAPTAAGPWSIVGTLVTNPTAAGTRQNIVGPQAFLRMNALTLTAGGVDAYIEALGPQGQTTI